MRKKKNRQLIAPGVSKLKWIGLSKDGRTNAWKLSCPLCGHEEKLPTTLFSKHSVTCDYCQASLAVNYNEAIASVIP